jgi:hypothetical protein
MENKLIKLFTYIFWLGIGVFIFLVFFNFYHLIANGKKLFPFYYLIMVIFLPLLGYLMMLFGEYIDKKNKK